MAQDKLSGLRTRLKNAQKRAFDLLDWLQMNPDTEQHRKTGRDWRSMVRDEADNYYKIKEEYEKLITDPDSPYYGRGL